VVAPFADAGEEMANSELQWAPTQGLLASWLKLVKGAGCNWVDT